MPSFKTTKCRFNKDIANHLGPYSTESSFKKDMIRRIQQAFNLVPDWQ